LQAAADPAVADYLFFVADCDPDQPGAHCFSAASAAYEVHRENVNRCR
jgi:cell division protein YceG involved in septum cleavage